MLHRNFLSWFFSFCLIQRFIKGVAEIDERDLLTCSWSSIKKMRKIIQCNLVQQEFNQKDVLHCFHNKRRNEWWQDFSFQLQENDWWQDCSFPFAGMIDDKIISFNCGFIQSFLIYYFPYSIFCLSFIDCMGFFDMVVKMEDSLALSSIIILL